MTELRAPGGEGPPQGPVGTAGVGGLGGLDVPAGRLDQGGLVEGASGRGARVGWGSGRAIEGWGPIALTIGDDH